MKLAVPITRDNKRFIKNGLKESGFSVSQKNVNKVLRDLKRMHRANLQEDVGWVLDEWEHEKENNHG